MLDHRVYRAAFLPALVALFVLAFSLTDRAAPRTTRLAPVAFDADRAYGNTSPAPRDSLIELAHAFPSRRPGTPGDLGVADRAAAWFRRTGFATAANVRRIRFDAETVDGDVGLEDVLARRVGLSSRTIVLLAHRDTRAGPALADLSGTAVLLELARVLADADLRKTVVLASVSGGSGGYAGARRVLDEIHAPIDAVIVLGDMASARTRRPFVVPWGNGARPAVQSLRRTVESALRRETGLDPGHDRGIAQWIRRALPLSLSEQGPLTGAGAPAVLVSASGERGPGRRAAVSKARFTGFGRAMLRAFTAADDAGSLESDPGQLSTPAFPGGDGIETTGRLVPGWAIRLLVAALLMPALLAAIDAFFRVRRRGLPAGRWLVWSASFGVALLVVWLWVRLLGAVGAVRTLDAPAPPGALPLHRSGWLALASTVLVGGLAFAVRPGLVRRLGSRGVASAGGGAAATGLLVALLTSAVWVVNPYAAAVLLPAAHFWLLAGAPERRGGRAAGYALVAAGLLGAVLVVLYYALAWGLGPLGAIWTAFGVVSGGTLGLADAVTLSLFGGAALATVAVIKGRARADAAAPPDKIVTRGPASYAGPGSLGGTESALRR